MKILGANKDSRQFLAGNPPRRFKPIERQVWKLIYRIEAATVPEDLKQPPGNQLKRLSGGEDGRWQVRVNDQYRIRFHIEGDTAIVEIGDFH